MRTALSISLALVLMLACGITAGQRIWVETAEDCGEWTKARKLKRSSPHEARLVGLLDPLPPACDLLQPELMLRRPAALLQADLTALACGPGLGGSLAGSRQGALDGLD